MKIFYKCLKCPMLLLVGFICCNQFPATANELADPAWLECFVGSMTDDQLAGQVMILHLERDKSRMEAKGLSTTQRSLVSSIQPGGLILYAENLLNPEQTRSLILESQDELLVPGFMSVDEEGGRVSRLQRSPEMKASKIPAAGQMAAQGPLAVWLGYLVIGRELAALGINMNFAPVADLGNQSLSDIVGDRAMGADAESSGQNCAVAVKALQACNILSVVKHFPGHGRSIGDSHYGIEEITASWEQLEAQDIKPFKEAFRAGADGVMTAHIWYSALEPEYLPVSMSARIMNDRLRKELGFDGLVVTDALDMKGATGYADSSTVGVRSLVAGADMLLCPVSPEKQKLAIVAALKTGGIDRSDLQRKVRRILAMKLKYGILKRDGSTIRAGLTVPVGDKSFIKLKSAETVGARIHQFIRNTFIVHQ